MLRKWVIALITLFISIYYYRYHHHQTTMQTARPVVVIGSGLAGLTSAHHLMAANIPVLLLEKESKVGGNSIKASSGINGAVTSTQQQKGINDSIDLFGNDTAKSARQLGDHKLREVLISESAAAIEWLKSLGVGLGIVNRLGGHSAMRTHRSDGIPPGFEIISKLKEDVFNNSLFELKTGAKVTELLQKNSSVWGVKYELEGEELEVETKNVVLATGGFGFSKELIGRYRPDLLGLPTTNAAGTLGEGVLLADNVGALSVDMDQVQVHPTGFIKLDDRDSHWKFLAAESLRAIGGVLVNTDGERFIDELQTRDTVSAAIRAQDQSMAYLILNEDMYKDFQFQIDFYTKMNLFQKLSLEEKFGDRAQKVLETLKLYSTSDPFNRKHKAHLFSDNLTTSDKLYIAEVTPVIHFTMGGVKINEHAEVVGKDGIIDGLFAVGEVSGGVHGANRLGGNSLLECVVFGRRVGARISAANSTT